MGVLEQVTVLMTIMRQLAEVMDHERRLLHGLRLEAMADLQAEKAALADAYAIEMRRLHAAPERLAELDEGIREDLGHAMQGFQRSLSANVHALQTARSALERLLRTIGDSLADAGTARPGYAGRPEARGEVIPVAFNRRI